MFFLPLYATLTAHILVCPTYDTALQAYNAAPEPVRPSPCRMYKGDFTPIASLQAKKEGKVPFNLLLGKIGRDWVYAVSAKVTWDALDA